MDERIIQYIMLELKQQEILRQIKAEMDFEKTCKEQIERIDRQMKEMLKEHEGS